MMIGSMKGRAIVAAAVAVLPTAAWAHPGHGEQGSAFLAGLQHPLTGFDHMAAMLMVGLWAGIALPRHIGAPPLAFIACMLAGFGWAAAGGALPLAEGMIATSLVVLGLAVCFAVRAPLTVALALVGLFALAHGHAHGAELPHGAVAWRFAAGFALTTALLHGAGLAVARFAGRPVSRFAGMLGVAGGVLLLATG
ncbi:urease accessory protein [Sphingobium indicum IP26]|nr:HupE/UreJ family protein [Sphingobium indicum]EPR16151.1 urease accessory protein [Sphingobium indicum IP26]